MNFQHNTRIHYIEWDGRMLTKNSKKSRKDCLKAAAAVAVATVQWCDGGGCEGGAASCGRGGGDAGGGGGGEWIMLWIIGWMIVWILGLDNWFG